MVSPGNSQLPWRKEGGVISKCLPPLPPLLAKNDRFCCWMAATLILLVLAAGFELATPCAQGLECHFGWVNVSIFAEIDSYKIVYSGFRLQSKNARM
jgi:hypothetical protein